MSDLTIYTNKPPHVPIELYVDGLVTDTCYAARALIMTLNAVGNNAPGLKLRNRAVSSVMSYYSDPNSCDRLSGQGFSARIEGRITDPKQNPALCAATRPADDPDAPGAPVPGFEKSSVTLPFTDPLKNSTRAFEKRQRANPEGQCAEPHAFKNLKDGHQLEVLPRVTTTVAVKVFYGRVSSSDPTIISIYFETVIRCDTCVNYQIFGDVPTDRHKKMIVFDLKDRDERNSVIPLIPLTPEIPIPHGRLLADGEQP
ncbi:hypothetical protein EDD86DRAFT_196864 [Gorgonomyces haynaldii]|nr:hypothetical protein EDD86DRAFT_196864 [Gorgonomyces haynaldii]